MSMTRKMDWVMNLIYNIILAVVLSALAEIINAGGITWPAIAYDTGVSYVLEMIIALYLPFTKWGFMAAMKSGAAPDSRKFRVISSIVTATPFAILMSLLMSGYSVIICLHLPVIVWIMAWAKIVILFIAVAIVSAYFLIPPCVMLAKKILGLPADHKVRPENHK